MTFTVAITTYNRPDTLAKLVDQVLMCKPIPEKILVVDSSDQMNEDMMEIPLVGYLHSSHKNQPYQRYLAFLVCTTDVIVFLDDDLEVLDYSVFDIIIDRLITQQAEGVSVGFEHHNSIQNQLEQKVDNQTLFFKIINLISGVPKLPAGKIRLAGLAGPRPELEGQVEYFNGAVMAFKLNALKEFYDPILFNIFEQKLGMGEDKVISMRVGLKKKLWYVPKNFFRHPPLESNYFLDTRSFQKKIMYSRLYISIVYGSLKHIPAFFVYTHYFYFGCWRLAIALVRKLFQPSKQNSEWLLGVWEGFVLAMCNPFSITRAEENIQWKKDAVFDSIQN